MQFKDFVYLSTRKIDQMYSQLAATSGIHEVEVNAEATIGVAKAGVSFKGGATDDSIQKMAHVLDHLKTSGAIGTLASESKYFVANISAHCLIIGGVYFFANGSEGSPDVLLGLACSLEFMIGGGYEGSESLSDLATPNGKAKAYGIKWTSSNPGFAQSLTSSERVIERADELMRLRQIWTEKYRLTDADTSALARKAWLNKIVKFSHTKPVPSTKSFWSFTPKEIWPPSEPLPLLEIQMPNRILKWLLGLPLYEAKVVALNKIAQLRKTVEVTGMDPLQIEVLREIRHLVKDRRPPIRLSYSDSAMLSQRYECVAVRVSDAVIDGERVVLGSPIYISL